MKTLPAPVPGGVAGEVELQKPPRGRGSEHFPRKLEILEGITVACIGPITARTARELGIRVDVVAEEYTIEGLVRAIVGEVAKRGER